MTALVSTFTTTNMFVDIEGRTRKITLSPKRALQPLFEAISNSIYALQDAGNPKKGKIEIFLERESDDQKKFFDTDDVRPIVNFTVSDNGTGFTDINFVAFNHSDTRHKPGARGIGRFTWLVAFDAVRVESVFASNGSKYQRSFDFVLRGQGIEHIEESEVESEATGTTVYLRGFKDKYKSKCEKKIDTIAAKIIEHFLFYFTQPNCPRITITDGRDTRILNDEYSTDVTGKNQPPVPFKIKGQEFKLLNLQLHLSRERKHAIHYCASQRVVKSVDAAARILDLSSKKVVDTSGNQFKYAAYVSGSYLDDHVRDDRTDFDFPSEDDLELEPDQITREEILRETFNQVRTFLEPYLAPIGEGKVARVTKFVEHKAPHYRPILKHRPNVLETIKPDASDAELDTQLHKALYEIERDAREQARQLINETPQNVSDIERYRANFDKLIETVNDVGKSQLAHYVIHRKLILDLLQNALGIQEGGEYSKEDRIHHMIYPMGTTSAEVPYEQQNLWIIDERLNYHQYLASNKQLRTTRRVNTTSQKRPDIVVFGGDADVTYSSVVIVEFKRPMRDDLGSEIRDPIRQLLGYSKDIENGTIKDENERRIPVNPATRYYCYLICDINEQIKFHAGVNHLVPAPDRMAFFGYHEFFKSYIEVIDYTKLVEDARKRNRAFIRKLNLPES